jgi:hypothetical protein
MEETARIKSCKIKTQAKNSGEIEEQNSSPVQSNNNSAIKNPRYLENPAMVVANLVS